MLQNFFSTCNCFVVVLRCCFPFEVISLVLLRSEIPWLYDKNEIFLVLWYLFYRCRTFSVTCLELAQASISNDHRPEVPNIFAASNLICAPNKFSSVHNFNWATDINRIQCQLHWPKPNLCLTKYPPCNTTQCTKKTWTGSQIPFFLRYHFRLKYFLALKSVTKYRISKIGK